MRQLLENFHFLRPAWLLLLPIAVGLWWLRQRRAEPLRGWREQMDADLLRPLVVGGKSARDYSSYVLLAAWVITVFAAAGPTWRLEPNPFAEDAQPLMILLKADQSMELASPAPSRIERAQLKIADLAKARKGEPMGLLAYAGSAHLVLPPTRDADVVAEMAAEVSPEIMPEMGDRLGLAIQQAGKLLQSQQNGGSLLVIADKADVDPQAVAATHQSSGRPPIQFLALTGADAPETKSIRDAAGALGASVENLTADDKDIAAVVDFAERRALTGIAGQSSRWQEAGYWLTPVLALIVALSFRRQQLAPPEDER